MIESKIPKDFILKREHIPDAIDLGIILDNYCRTCCRIDCRLQKNLTYAVEKDAVFWPKEFGILKLKEGNDLRKIAFCEKYINPEFKNPQWLGVFGRLSEKLGRIDQRDYFPQQI